MTKTDFEPPQLTEEGMRLVGKSYAVRERYWSEYTWPLQTSYIPDIEKIKTKLDDLNLDPMKFRLRYADIFNKVNASYYHYRRLKENEDLMIEIGKEMANEGRKKLPPNVVGMAGLTYEPIEHEYEAMLVTLKSALDITIMMLAPFCSTKADDLNKFVKEIEVKKSQNETLKKIIKLVNNTDNRLTIDEFLNKPGVRSKRNHAVHEGSVPTGTININYVSTTNELRILKTLTMAIGSDVPDFAQGQPLEEFCEMLFYGVSELVIQISEVIFEHEIDRGRKISVYERKLGKHS